jgi:hypothetical protein
MGIATAPSFFEAKKYLVTIIESLHVKDSKIG